MIGESKGQAQFWVVARLDGVGYGPKKKHSTYPLAVAEMERLARLEKGVEFFVLAPLASAKTAEAPLIRQLWSY